MSVYTRKEKADLKKKFLEGKADTTAVFTKAFNRVEGRATAYGALLGLELTRMGYSFDRAVFEASFNSGALLVSIYNPGGDFYTMKTLERAAFKHFGILHKLYWKGHGHVRTLLGASDKERAE